MAEPDLVLLAALRSTGSHCSSAAAYIHDSLLQLDKLGENTSNDADKLRDALEKLYEVNRTIGKMANRRSSI